MTRGYGQFCGIARALELIGGRWTLLIVRDLLVGPKRFGELQQGLPGIPTNILSSRLKELEEAGILERTLQVRPATSVVYQLTPYGRELEDALVRLGLWGAKSLAPPGKDDFFNVGSLAIALRAAFDTNQTSDLDLLFEIRIDGSRLFVHVSGGEVSFPAEPPRPADVVLESAPDVLSKLLTRYTDFNSALEAHALQIEGSKRAARRFFEVFRLPAPESAQVKASTDATSGRDQ